MACAEGELHDLPLLLFGLVLRGYGWRISYLGADTPLASLVQTVEALPRSRSLSPVRWPALDRRGELREVALHAPLYVSGAAATEQIAQRAHGTFLNHDLLMAAETLPHAVAAESRDAGRRRDDTRLDHERVRDRFGCSRVASVDRDHERGGHGRRGRCAATRAALPGRGSELHVRARSAERARDRDRPVAGGRGPTASIRPSPGSES